MNSGLVIDNFQVNLSEGKEKEKKKVNI